MFERKSSTEQGSTDPAVEDGATRQDGRVRRHAGTATGTTAGTTTGTTGAHARPVATDSERRDAGVAPAGATRTDPATSGPRGPPLPRCATSGPRPSRRPRTSSTAA